MTAACDSFMMSDLPDGDNTDGKKIEIVTGVQLPEMSFASKSKSMGEQPTIDDLRNNLKINVFVFDPSGVMLQFIGPEDIQIVDVDPNSEIVYFKVSNIYSSSLPRRLHFVITSADDLHNISGGEYITAMASETTTMPALVVDGDTDAYWGIKEVDRIEDNMELTVKLIRNFVQLSVNVNNSIPSSTFRLLGYTVVNRPSRGTIAPYIYRDHLFASFFDADDALKSYDEITAQGYFGVNPSGSDLTMTHTTEAEVQASLTESENLMAAGATDTPYYIYERSQSNITSAGSGVKSTYIIIVGEYQGKRCYYKIDIGHDVDGKFKFYDLLRNFRYTVNINEVGGEGAPTLLEAMHGAAHNNLSTSIITRDLFSIGYGGERIEVSSTRVIITEKATDHTLRFRYTTRDGVRFDPSLLKIFNTDNEEIEFNMSGVNVGSHKNIELQGNVINSAWLSKDQDNWYVLHISTNDIPTDSRRLEQNIYIYYNGSAGLGRTVTLMLRRPWEFGNVTATSPGATISSDMSINFDLPSGLSQTQFPLIITFESDKQNIYALNGSQLTVATGQSDFKGATTDQVISYELRIEWEDYSATDGLHITAPFRTNTTAANDRAYNTSSIDAQGIEGRTNNNNSPNFCIRISNKGQKYIDPFYVNVIR